MSAEHPAQTASPPPKPSSPHGRDAWSPAPVLLVAAMAEEAAAITSRVREPHETPAPFPGVQRPVRAIAGLLQGTRVVVLTCGIGAVAASSAATWAILEQRPRAVISVGTCGGLAEDIEVGTLVLGREFTSFLADATVFGYAPGQVPGQPERFFADTGLIERARTAVPEARSGLALSGDAFVTAPLADPLRERFPGALSADMESAALAQTCAATGVPFLSLRAVSDLCGPRADQQFHLQLDVAAEASATGVERVIAALD